MSAYLQRAELALGGLTSAVALATIVYGFFRPLICDAGGKHCLSVVASQGLGSVGGLMVGLVLLSLGIGWGAIAHARGGPSGGLGVFWLCAILLFAFTALGAASIGLFFIPADVLVLVTGAVAMARGIMRRL